jgi:hypothetical protein
MAGICWWFICSDFNIGLRSFIDFSDFTGAKLGIVDGIYKFGFNFLSIELRRSIQQVTPSHQLKQQGKNSFRNLLKAILMLSV